MYAWLGSYCIVYTWLVRIGNQRSIAEPKPTAETSIFGPELKFFFAGSDN